jgi:hypothetical protein
MSAEEVVPSCDLSGQDVACCEGGICDRSSCPCETTAECCLSEDDGLRQRLRNTVEQLVGDLSGNPTVLHPIFQPPVIVDDLSKYPQISYHEVYMMSIMYFLQFMNVMSRFLGSSWTVCKNVYKGVKRSLSENVYVFFEGSSYPYALDEIDMKSPGVPSVEWYYNHTTHTFISARLYNNSQHYQTHHVPYLSTELQYNDLTLYDVTEFMNDVRWAGEEGEPMPNADHLVSAWTLHSGVVVKRSDAVSLRVINTDGDEQRVPLRNQA